MLTITIEAYVPAAQAQGVKEDIAMYLERYGDARVVSVEASQEPEQRQGKQESMFDLGMSE